MLCTPNGGQILLFNVFHAKKHWKLYIFPRLDSNCCIFQPAFGVLHTPNAGQNIQQVTLNLSPKVCISLTLICPKKLFHFLHEKSWKSRFQPAFGLRSTQMLVKIYIRVWEWTSILYWKNLTRSSIVIQRTSAGLVYLLWLRSTTWGWMRLKYKNKQWLHCRKYKKMLFSFSLSLSIYRRLSRSWQLRGLVPVSWLGVPPRCNAR